MTRIEIDEDLVSGIKFRVFPAQVALLVVIILVLISLAFTTTNSSKRAVTQAQIMTQAESTSSSIIFTQREALVYTTRYAQWLGGSITRRDVQIARALLAQRLSVVDVGGVSMGARATPEFTVALTDSDEIILQAPAGFLPADISAQLKKKAAPVISEIVNQSRKLIVAYQSDLDAQFRKTAVERANSARLNLILLSILITLTSIFIFWIAFTFRRYYLLAKDRIIKEQDILKNARTELDKAQDQLIILNDLNIAKNEFISTINHELRTPLTSIIGYVDFLKSADQKIDPAEFRKIVSVLETNSNALLDLVESILSLTKLDSEIIAEDHEVQNLLPILDNVLVMLSGQANKKSLKINFHTDASENYAVRGNRTQISQVFVNLISNAIKFSEPGSKVDVSLTRIVDSNLDVVIECVFEDYGMGIPVGDQDKLFLRFFRARNAADGQIPGTGLGLAIVKKTMELHGGKVSVTSKEGIGSTFKLEFPGLKSEVEKMVEERRLEVLVKAITAIEGATNEDLPSICHKMGGSIAFYTFEIEGKELEEFSVALQSPRKMTDKQIQLKKEHLIDYLKFRQTELTKQGAIEHEE